tara:strand:- start:3826 stop:4950 length:1125 start_codon:yes stop_codon:yes gene_type:complete
MIPTNSNSTSTCDPISSNCVIWQGEDLTCVNVCQGDTISDVVSALCTQLTILQATDSSGVTFDITNINQSTLSGTAATNLTELIQLMIDNIVINQGGGTSTGGGTHSSFGCGEVLKCTVSYPECFYTILPAGGSLNDWITAVSNTLCSQRTGGGTQAKITTALQQRVTNLEQAPKGEPTPRVYSSGVVTKNILTPIDKVVQALDAQFIQLRSTTGTSSNIALGVNSQPANAATALSTPGFVRSLNANPVTGGDALLNIWTLLDDARTAITEIQKSCCNTLQLTRMGGINSLYASATQCSGALTAASRSADCFDIWNSTGVQFDPTVPAYTSPYSPGSVTELMNGRWYSLCSAGPVSLYSITAPHWGTPLQTCTE